MSETVLKLSVRNHPGVMAKITGLFARRAYNLEGLLCVPEGDGSSSRMHLMVKDNDQLPHIIKNLEELYDVHTLTAESGPGPFVNIQTHA